MEQNIDSNRALMIEAFLYETNEMLEHLIEILIESEKINDISEENINEIFRIMHTVKGSSAMLSYDNISETAHLAEDLFSAIRNNRHKNIDYAGICDISLEVADYLKEQIICVERNEDVSPPSAALIENLRDLVTTVGGAANEVSQESGGTNYIVWVTFEPDCKMENIRAYSLIGKLKDICTITSHKPEELLEDNNSADYISANRFEIHLKTTQDIKDIEDVIQKEMFVQEVTSKKEEQKSEIVVSQTQAQVKTQSTTQQASASDSLQNVKNNFFNIHVSKLDKLMDLVGEIAINKKLFESDDEDELDEYSRSSSQSQKLIRELQDAVMALRMVPIAGTFHKMNKVVRDMCKSLQKDVELILAGEDTEVDKIIADNMGDPLMHIVRNSMDHGIEDSQTRLENGKSAKGRIILEAKNTGEEVVIKIIDDGRGLDRDKILKKAMEKNLVSSSRTLSDKEIYNLILLPGFSTTDQVTEYSGRGVGMDVVHKNIEKMGGSISIDSEKGNGMTQTIKIPLTLTIINGMEITANNMNFIISTTAIRKIFKIEEMGHVRTEEGKEFIMVGKECCPIVRLSNLFQLDGESTALEDGILILVESEQKAVCIFADALLGEQQVVVKPLPIYFMKFAIRKCGVSGCTILGGDHISLILDTNEIIQNEI